MTSIFGATDPVELLQRWLTEAEPSELNDPNAMALATVDADGRPNVRIVLLKGIEPDGFVFYTNYESDKARELETARHAAFALHWKSTRRQVRVRGVVEREDGPVADAYYASRPLDSRLGAWASKQSRPLAGREILVDAVEQARAQHGDSPPRPPYWGGYRIRPLEMEFWADGEFRLHDRERWIRPEPGGDWAVFRLYP